MMPVSVLVTWSTTVGLGTAAAQEAAAPGPAAGFEPPRQMEQPLSDEELRQALVAQKESLCNDLEFLAGIITSTGILGDVPPTISNVTGIPINELEARETEACQQRNAAPDAQKSTATLLNEARTAQWLVKIHLAAMDRVLMQNPNYRPINAEGSFRAFLQMHNITIERMRDLYLALAEDPTVEEGRSFERFLEESLVQHARAEEETLFPLAQRIGGEQLTQSAQLVESEHETLDELIARYRDTLSAVEAGQAETEALVPIARQLRIRSELHFGKEEQSVIRPLQEQISAEDFRPVVVEFDQRLGGWLREHGWDWPQGR